MTQFKSDVIHWSFEPHPDPSGQTPPTKYYVHYDLRGIIDGSSSEPIYHTGFDVEIDISPPYPTSKARAKFTSTPIWHPNVNPDGRICYEDRWIPGAGLRLEQIIEIIGRMIAYQLFGERDQKPVRTDDAFWRQFNKHRPLFPTDERALRNWDISDVIIFGTG